MKYICDPLQNPENGRYLPNTATPIGTELAIICDHGYHPNSEEPVECDDVEDGKDAMWVGNLPICGKTFKNNNYTSNTSSVHTNSILL